MKKLQKPKTKKLIVFLVILTAIPLIMLGGFLLITLWQQKSDVNKVAEHINLSPEYRKVSVQADELICWTSECKRTITWEVPKTSRVVFEEVAQKLKQNGFSVDDDELYYLGNPKVKDFIFRSSYQEADMYYGMQVIIDDGLSDGQSEFRLNPESKLIIQFKDLTAFTF